MADEEQGVRIAPKKSLCISYLLAIPFGWLGLQHFYLNRVGWGLLYLFTLGLLGWGWICDLVRLPCLVSSVNEELEARARGQYIPPRKRLDDGYILVIPYGWLGLHMYYLDRVCCGLLYTFTLGICGIGWIIDIIRMPCLVSSTNEDLAKRHAPQTLIVTTTHQIPAAPSAGHIEVHVYGRPGQQPVTTGATIYPPLQQSSGYLPQQGGGYPLVQTAGYPLQQEGYAYQNAAPPQYQEAPPQVYASYHATTENQKTPSAPPVETY
ncbi:uncharacterized protein LOC144363561 [Saccoglossus kowalevskii]